MNAKLAGHIGYAHRLAAIGEGRVAGDDEQVRIARQLGDDVFRDPVGKVYVLNAIAHIVEGKHCDRGFVRERQRRSGYSGGPRQYHAVDPHRPRDVLEPLFADIEELGQYLALNLLIGRSGNADAAGLGYPFKASGNVDPIAEQVVAFRHYVAEIDADPKLDALLGGNVGIPAIHPALDIDRTAYRVNHGSKLDEDAVAGRLNDPAAMERDGRIDQLAAQLAQAFKRAFLIEASQPGIA